MIKLNKNEEEIKKFLENNIKIFFVNLVRYKDHNNIPVPILGIDKVLSFFKDSVEEDLKKLENCCFSKDEENCVKICNKNPLLKNYSNFEKINKDNKKEAKKFLKGLKAGAFFTGMIPGLDIGMEYYYRNILKTKLKSLYGFDYDNAKKTAIKYNLIIENSEIIKKDNEENEYLLKALGQEGINDIKEEINEFEEGKNNKNKNENKQNYNSSNNKFKNTTGILRGIFEAGSVTIKVGRIVLNSTVKVVSWSLLPVTCIGFGTWSSLKIDKDCEKILNIFEKSLPYLKFETLNFR